MEEFTQSLMGAGLSDKEAVIYVAILRSGKISLSDIAMHTQIRRTTIYQHVGALLNRGLISKSIKGKRILYAPENPKKILSLLEKNRATFLEQAEYMEGLYRSARHKPNVRLYEGSEGIVQILQEIGSSLVVIDAFFSPEKFFRVIPKKDSNEFLLTIEKNQNMLRDLVESDSVSEDFVKNVRKTQSAYHKVKFLPKDFPVSVDVLVTGNKVAMISFDNMMGLIVENAEIATFHKSIHGFFWKNLSM